MQRIGRTNETSNLPYLLFVKNRAAETTGRQKLNICFQCHSSARGGSGILPTVRDRKKDSGQARMTQKAQASKNPLKILSYHAIGTLHPILSLIFRLKS